jgi:hypothetical protein
VPRIGVRGDMIWADARGALFLGISVVENPFSVVGGPPSAAARFDSRGRLSYMFCRVLRGEEGSCR